MHKNKELVSSSSAFGITEKWTTCFPTSSGRRLTHSEQCTPP